MSLIQTSQLEAALQMFSDERDWGQFHTPKNLAMALTGEVGELHELLQWKTDAEILGAVRALMTGAASRSPRWGN